MIPGPVQRPRPRITIAAHGTRMLRIAAQRGDGWSQWGGYDIETERQFFEVTRDRCTRFAAACADVGRDPATARHSLVCFPPLTPWESPGYSDDMVGRYAAVGIDEFVLYWPQNWRNAPHEDVTFEEICGDHLQILRHL